LPEGCWFNIDTAIRFSEASQWDGENLVSRATGSQSSHQYLYYTASGNWVLNCWYQGIETYEKIGEERAISWLISQEHFDDLDLPDSVQKRVAAGIESAEV
jgi:hypothetical protein